MTDFDFTNELKILKEAIAEQKETKRKVLQELDFVVLDNSIRETTVGQLRGHTLENKIKIYQEAKKCGFDFFIVASFNHMTRVGDTFCQWLKDNNEDRSNLFSFSEITEGVSKGVVDIETLPVALEKCKQYGIPNVVFEMDLADRRIDWPGKFTVHDMCQLLLKRLNWCYENLSPKSKVLFSFRDFAFAMKETDGAVRVLTVVKFLGSLPNRGFGICFEEPGKFLPEELGAWCASVRRVMNSCNWQNGRLLVHLHKRWGFALINQLECLMNGADGVWAGVCEEGASVGHASSTLTIMNLIRMGNTKVLDKYNCHCLREAAINVTQLTTGKPPHFRELIYGERALDLWLPGEENAIREFDLAEFFGQEPPNRITDLSSLEMIRDRLVNSFGEDEQFTLDMAKKMKELLLKDMSSGRKEEYMSEAGIALLFDRAGGQLTSKMRDVIEKIKVNGPHAQNLIDDIRKIWDEWDLKERGHQRGDDRLHFDSFYNGFMAPYFGCYRCDDTRKGLQALDMDNDDYVDWSEFLVYLKWAVRQYPKVADADELLSVTFRKGLIPAMQDVNLKEAGIERPRRRRRRRRRSRCRSWSRSRSRSKSRSRSHS